MELPGWVFNAADHLDAIVGYIMEFDEAGACARPTAAVDMFAGKAAITKRLAKQKMRCASFDAAAGGDGENILTKAGFYKALALVLSIVPYGLLVGGPPCNLWVFLRSSIHQRTAVTSVRILSMLGVAGRSSKR